MPSVYGDIDVECTRESGTLYIDEIDMHRQAFCVMDVTPLWWGAEQRGSDIQIPTMSGVLPMPRRRAVTVRSVPMIIDGGWTINDTRQSNYSQGMFDTIRWIDANITAPATSDDGTRLIYLTTPDGENAYWAYGHVKLLTGARTARYVRAVLEISIPYGQLVLNE